MPKLPWADGSTAASRSHTVRWLNHPTTFLAFCQMSIPIQHGAVPGNPIDQFPLSMITWNGKPINLLGICDIYRNRNFDVAALNVEPIGS